MHNLKWLQVVQKRYGKPNQNSISLQYSGMDLLTCFCAFSFYVVAKHSDQSNEYFMNAVEVDSMWCSPNVCEVYLYLSVIKPSSNRNAIGQKMSTKNTSIFNCDYKVQRSFLYRKQINWSINRDTGMVESGREAKWGRDEYRKNRDCKRENSNNFNAGLINISISLCCQIFTNITQIKSADFEFYLTFDLSHSLFFSLLHIKTHKHICYLINEIKSMRWYVYIATPIPNQIKHARKHTKRIQWKSLHQWSINSNIWLV